MNYVEIEPSGRIVQCGSAPFATLAEMPGADPVDVFTRLREGKNTFRG